MKIAIKTRPGARQTSVERKADGSLVVKVKEPAREGWANEAVIEAVAGYFDVPKTKVRILRGGAGRNKLIEIGGLKK